jgi:hypothetical protein
MTYDIIDIEAEIIRMEKECAASPPHAPGGTRKTAGITPPSADEGKTPAARRAEHAFAQQLLDWSRSL